MGAVLPVELSLTLDRKTRLAVQKDLADIKNGFKKAMPVAVNRTAKTGQTQIGQQVRRVIRVNKRSADKRINLRGRATQKNPTTTLRLDRHYKFHDSPLITSFRGTRDTRKFASGNRAGQLKRRKSGKLIPGKGVIVNPRVRGGKQTLKHAFIIDGRGGTRVAVARAKDGRKTGYDKTRGRRRTALVAMRGPSVLGIYENSGNIKRHIETNVLPRTLQKNMLSQVDRLLKRKR